MITDVSGASPVSVGGPISVTFTLKDDDGATIPFEDLDRFSIYVSGPASNYQRVIVPEPSTGDPNAAKANLTTNADGSLTYKFTNPFPSVYAAPVNKPSGAANATNELTGQAVAAGTYTVGIEARKTFTVDGESIRKAGDATFDFAVGGATLAARQIVTQANCNQCHVSMSVHGENRHLLTGCVLCHTPGAKDSLGTTSIELSEMIHKLHRGADLPQVSATDSGTDPYKYEVGGFRGSIVDFSKVMFPWLPGGTGFNWQTRNCGVCHGGASQESQIYANQNITKARCSTCHDDIDFTAGTILDPNNPNVRNGLLTKAQLADASYRIFPGGIGGSPGSGTQHSFSDTFNGGVNSCYFCHGAGSGGAYEVEAIHVPPLANPAKIIGLQVVVQKVLGNANAGFFAAGEKPIVTFDLLDEDGAQVAIDDVASISFVMSGPVENYQRILPTDPNASTLTIKSTTATNCTPTTGKGPFTYTSSVAIPTNFPTPPRAQAGDFPYADGWGNMVGRPMLNGAYTIMVYAYRQFTYENRSYRETSLPGLYPTRIGSAGSFASYSGMVTDATCNSCHGDDIRFHGSGRRGVENCVMCHVAGAEIKATGSVPAGSIDWKVMIHKIHAAGILTDGKWEIGDAVFEGVLPVMPDGAKHCVACHATDAWKTPVANENVNVWKVACTSCHDSDAAVVHVQLNTLGVGQEGCAVCHGDGKLVSVEEAHATP